VTDVIKYTSLRHSAAAQLSRTPVFRDYSYLHHQGRIDVWSDGYVLQNIGDLLCSDASECLRQSDCITINQI
jgi:hypothetical protein